MTDAPEQAWLFYDAEMDDAVWSEYPTCDGLEGHAHLGQYVRKDVADLARPVTVAEAAKVLLDANNGVSDYEVNGLEIEPDDFWGSLRELSHEGGE